MERKNRSTIVTIRIPDGLLQKIECDIEISGEFASRADYILEAIREFYRIRHTTKKKEEGR